MHDAGPDAAHRTRAGGGMLRGATCIGLEAWTGEAGA